MSAPLPPPPRPPLPGDLQRRLDILLAKAALRRFPKLCEAVTALVQDAWCRRPGREETAAARARNRLGRTQEAPDRTEIPRWPGLPS
jgi:hypothetical protein